MRTGPLGGQQCWGCPPASGFDEWLAEQWFHWDVTLRRWRQYVSGRKRMGSIWGMHLGHYVRVHHLCKRVLESANNGSHHSEKWTGDLTRTGGKKHPWRAVGGRSHYTADGTTDREPLWGNEHSSLLKSIILDPQAYRLFRSHTKPVWLFLAM